MAGLPTGLVTLLFSDIEGSTRLLASLGDRFAQLVADHRRVLRDAIAAHGGTEVGTQGDGHYAVFVDPLDALRAAIDSQVALGRHAWPDGLTVRVRMGVHTGDVGSAYGEYYGMGLHGAARVSAAAHGGQILVSEATHRVVRDRLPESIVMDDLGYHVLKDLGPPQQLFQLSHASLDGPFPPPVTLSVVPNNLPAAISSFVGRSDEIAQLDRLLATHRLVTVLGPGGAGKTRTAVQVAAGLVERFAHGVWFVDLASVDRSGSVAAALARVLGVREEAGRSLRETVEDRLRWQAPLLVLDNCEHLIDQCASLVASLLRNCPDVVVLATSRTHLGVPGEVVHPLAAMSVSDEPGSADDAVRLFVERAAAVTGGLQFDPDELTTIADICRRLDGLPLAIELAAARTNVLSVAQIAERIGDLRFLSGARGVPERQHSLDALIDWSYQLLTAAERAVLMRCSVFAGPFDLEAAGAVSGAEGDVLDALSALASSSLLIVDRGAKVVRYRLLETIRSFARERLHEAGEFERARERHREYLVQVAMRARPELDGADQAEWFDHLTSHADDLTDAISSGLASGAVDDSAVILTALRRFWLERGDLRTMLEWSRRVGDAIAESSPHHVDLLITHGLLEGVLGDRDRAVALLERAGGIAADEDDDRLRERVASNLGILAERMGDLEGAEAHHREALECARRSGDALALASSLGNLGNVAFQRGVLDVAEELHIQALDAATQADARRVVANSWNTLGLVAWVRGDLQLASERMTNAVTLMRPLGTGGIPLALGNLAGISRDLGDLRRALDMQTEVVALAERGGDPMAVSSSLSSLGTMQWDLDQHEAAVASWTRALEIARGAGIGHETLSALYNLTIYQVETGDLDGARSGADEMLVLARRVGDVRYEGHASSVLASIAFETSDVAGAERLATDALELADRVGDASGAVTALTMLARCAAERDDIDGALALLDEVERRCEGQDGWLLIEPLATRVRIAARLDNTDALKDAFGRLSVLADGANDWVRKTISETIATLRAELAKIDR